MDIPFCVLKLGIKTNVPIFKSVAGMEREIIWLFIFCLCNNLFVTFGVFHNLFYLYLKSIRYVYRKLILKFLDDESGLDHEYVMVDYNKLNLCLVDNILVYFNIYLL